LKIGAQLVREHDRVLHRVTLVGGGYAWSGAGAVNVETVRYYQRRGLLEVPQRPETGGHGGSVRRYAERDVRRLRFIRSAQAAGFTLEQIAELIALDATDVRTRARELARERITELDAKIAEIKTARDAGVTPVRWTGER
jgi:MerR family mercuric resistance operon transcriptional regulator